MRKGDASTPARILVVDDSPDQLMLASAALEQAGFVTEEAESGEEALEKVRARKPDALLLDVMMPGIDGFRVCERLRAAPETHDLPVMIATGLGDVASVERAYGAGATDFVTKPINWALLGHRMRYMLRSANIAARLGVSERRFKALFEGAAVGIVAANPKGEIVAANAAFAAMLGREADALVGQPFDALIHEEDRARRRAAIEAVLAGVNACDRREERYLRADGEIAHGQATDALVADDAGKALYVISSVEDVTERLEMEERLRELASYDSLTRLPNRSLFKDVLAQASSDSARSGDAPEAGAAAIVLDLDRFKTINDSLGPEAGDEILRQVAARLASCVRDPDLLGRGARIDGVAARIDGDTFAIALRDPKSHERAGSIAARLIERINAPMSIDGRSITIGASLGIALFPFDGENAEALFANAEAAMYDAKRRGRNRHQFYSMAMNEAAQARLTLEGELRAALDAEAFELHYQPQLSLATGALVGVEALMRWPREDGSFVRPDRFVTLAEEMGLVDRLGFFALRRACRDIVRWRRMGLDDFRVAVNVSGRQLGDRALAGEIRRTVREAGVDPERICIEVTESAAMSDVENAIAVLSELKELGFPIAIDDFGTGYSSLNQLRRLPLNELKIDQTFVAAIEEDESQAVFVEIIVSLALSLGLEIVAEGIENAHQADLLAGFGAHLGQGWFYGKAMSAEDLAAWARDRYGEAILVAPPPKKRIAAKVMRRGVEAR